MTRSLHRPALISLLLLCLSVPAGADSPTSPHSGGSERGWSRLQERLDLTARQTEALKPLLKAYQARRREHLHEFRANLEKVLTPQQLSTFKAKHTSSRAHHHEHEHEHKIGERRDMLETLGDDLHLSAEQKNSIGTLRRTTRDTLRADREHFLQEAAGILKPEQKVKMRELLQKHEGRHGGSAADKQPPAEGHAESAPTSASPAPHPSAKP
jgi:Spy/CpxP family protein refolding chaperone